MGKSESISSIRIHACLEACLCLGTSDLQDWCIRRSQKYLLSKTGFSWKQSTWRNRSRQVTDSSQTTILLVGQVEKKRDSSGLNYCVGFMGRTTAEGGPRCDTFSQKYHRRFSIYYLQWNCPIKKYLRCNIHINAKPLLVKLTTTQILHNKKPNDNRVSYNNILYIISLTKTLHGSIFKNCNPHSIQWLVPTLISILHTEC
jgi:hypothetical protein